MDSFTRMLDDNVSFLNDDVSLAFSQASVSEFQPESPMTSLPIRSPVSLPSVSGSTTTYPNHPVLPDGTLASQTRQSEPRQLISDDWERIRPIFTTLYQDNRMKLKDIMVTLRMNYKFDATENMYKKRITQWRLRKSATHDEKAKFAALAQQYRVEGKPLPTHDEYGHEIPWVQVRRQAGSRVIPKGMLRNIARPDIAIQNQSIELIQPLIPAHVRRLDSMFYHISSICVWQRSERVFYTPGSSLWDAYANAISLLHISPATAGFALSAAAQEISQKLPPPGVNTLLDLFIVIVMYSQYLETAYLLSTVQFLISSYLHAYGLHNPLVLFLRQLWDLMKLSSIQAESVSHILHQCHLSELTEHVHHEYLTTDAGVAFKPGEIFITRRKCIGTLEVTRLSTGSRVDETANTLCLAEKLCHELILWSTEIYGSFHLMTQHAKTSLSMVYQRQGRFEECRSVLDPMWKLWCQTFRSHDQTDLEHRGSWCPARLLALACKRQNDFANYQFYQQKAIQYFNLNFGSRHSFTLLHLNELLEFHAVRKNNGALQHLIELYPDSCIQLVKLYIQAT